MFDNYLVIIVITIEMEPNSYYTPTQQECIDFNKHRAGYASSVRVDLKKEKATHGQLVHIEGNNVTVVKYNAPWALLQSLKNQYSFTERKKLFLKGLSWKKK